MLLKGASGFWPALEQLLAQSRVVIDRPRGSAHPRYPHVIYPVDYGYLEQTAALDGEGIDLWRGSLPQPTLGGVLLTVDLTKRDSEIKLLLGCTREEIDTILAFHNSSPYMKGMLIPRDIE